MAVSTIQLSTRQERTNDRLLFYIEKQHFLSISYMRSVKCVCQIDIFKININKSPTLFFFLRPTTQIRRMAEKVKMHLRIDIDKPVACEAFY
jgi:hypothetical protein